MITRHVHLSPREEQVIHRVADGWTYQKIGESLGISTETVKVYAKRVAAKAGFSCFKRTRDVVLILAWEMHLRGDELMASYPTPVP